MQNPRRSHGGSPAQRKTPAAARQSASDFPECPARSGADAPTRSRSLAALAAYTAGAFRPAASRAPEALRPRRSQRLPAFGLSSSPRRRGCRAGRRRSAPPRAPGSPAPAGHRPPLRKMPFRFCRRKTPFRRCSPAEGPAAAGAEAPRSCRTPAPSAPRPGFDEAATDGPASREGRCAAAPFPRLRAFSPPHAATLPAHRKMFRPFPAHPPPAIRAGPAAAPAAAGADKACRARSDSSVRRSPCAHLPMQNCQR